MDMTEERLSNRTEVKDMDTTGKHIYGGGYDNGFEAG
jgi:hypothetical protein